MLLFYYSCGADFSFSYAARIAELICSLVSVLSGCTVSLYSPLGDCFDGIAMNNPLLPSITLTSCTTNALSIVKEATAFNLLSSLVTNLILMSVIFKSVHLPLF